jgi:hypothetical protein
MRGVKVRTVGGFGAGELGCARLGGAGEMDQDIFSQLISQTHPAFRKTWSLFVKRSMRSVAITWKQRGIHYYKTIFRKKTQTHQRVWLELLRQMSRHLRSCSSPSTTPTQVPSTILPASSLFTLPGSLPTKFFKTIAGDTVFFLFLVVGSFAVSVGLRLSPQTTKKKSPTLGSGHIYIYIHVHILYIYIHIYM